MIDILQDEPRGRIFIVQVARAVDYADHSGQPHLKELLREFVVECARRVAQNEVHRDKFWKLDSEKTFYEPIIVPDQGRYLHKDTAVLEGSPQLATVVSLSALRMHMLDDSLKELEEKDLWGFSDAFTEVDDSTWRQGARVGVKHNKYGSSNHFWTTRFEALAALVPDLRNAPSGTILNKEEGETVRNHLGLGHFDEGEALALLVFDEEALERERELDKQRDPDDRVFQFTRPYLFEGVGNHRFHIFKPEDTTRWNNALELAAIEKIKKPRGGPEAVLTSVPCTYVRRIYLLAGLSEPPCLDAEPAIEEIMLEGERFGDVVALVQNLLEDHS